MAEDHKKSERSEMGWLDGSKRHSRQSEEWDRSCFENSLVGIAETTLENRFVQVNDRLCEILGYSREALMKMTWDQITHPDDLEEQIVKFDHVLSSEVDHYIVDKRFIRYDGHVIQANVESRLMRNADGSPNFFLKIVLDISEQKRLEQSLFENQCLLNETQSIAEIGSWELDLASGKLIWTAEVYRIFEIDQDGSPASYEAFLDCVHPEDRMAVNNAYLDSVKNRLPYEITHRLLMRDGRTKWVKERGASSYDKDGQALRSVGTVQDVTRDKLSELTMLQHKLVIATAHDGYWMVNALGYIVEVNESYADISGYSIEELVGMHINQLDAVEHPQDTRARIEKIHVQGYDRFETRHRRKDGRLVDLEVSVNYLPETGNIFAFFRDIGDRKRIEDDLRIAATTFQMQEAIMITDHEAKILRVNKGFEKITGYTEAEVIGCNPRILSSGRHDQAFYSQMWHGLLINGSWSGEIWDRHKNGHIYPKHTMITAVKNKLGTVTHYVCAFNDITERKRIEEEVYNLAYYDPLTNLPNRRMIMERLNKAISVSARSKQYGALLFLDLDKFKTLNDSLGHEFGDLLLMEVSHRLKQCLRDVDTVARLGGDEFLILLENFGELSSEATFHASQIAEKVRAVLAASYQLRNHLYHTSPSIGICLFKGDEISTEELVKRADIAMYQAKDAGRNVFKFFDPELQRAVETRAMIEAELREAIANRELLLHYQVQVDMDGRPLGAEALIRWERPSRGMVSPAQFIPIAEESSLILDIGHFVLDAAGSQLAQWAAHEHTRNISLAVNISALQFTQADFVEQVKAVIDRYAFNPARLKLELTESVALDDLDIVVYKLLALRQVLGVSLSLDDFGTGYSSLSYLKRLPIHQIKIDQSFVRELRPETSDAVMVKTIIDLARNFKLEVIAEGVETEQHLALLRSYGCEGFQGYFFSKPLPIETFMELLEKMNST